MIVAVVGSSEGSWASHQLPTVNAIFQSINYMLQPDLIISGASPKGGVDAWIDHFCKNNGIDFQDYPPQSNDWPGYKARNLIIAQSCDTLVAIRSKYSTSYGSGWTADRAEELGKRVIRFKI